MNSKNIFGKVLLSAGILAAGALTSCEDFLTIMPTNQIPEQNFWQDKADVDNVRAAAYRQVASDDYTQRIIYWGELRGDNVVLNDQTQTEVQNLQNAILMPTASMFNWSSFYTAINYCNKVLEKGQEMVDNRVDPSFTSSQWLPVKAEMLGLRALSYFYLVRSFRDVPYITRAISTDEEALQTKEGSQPGAMILGDLTAQLEGVKDYAAESFGSNSESKGRLTRRGIRAILADIYLWRGCMLNKALEKGDTLTATAGDTLLVSSLSIGDTLQTTQLNSLRKACFNKTIEHCDQIMAMIQEDYDEFIQENPNYQEQLGEYVYKKRYKYLTFMKVYSNYGGTDYIYRELFGESGNSEYESVFELQYDGSNLKNTTFSKMFASYDGTRISSSMMAGSSNLTSGASSSNDPTVGYGKTDLRLLETFDYKPTSMSSPVLHKFTLTSLNVSDFTDVTEGSNSATYSSDGDANFPIYRLTDVMLMKAEAIARVVPTSVNLKGENINEPSSNDAALLLEGFFLTNAIYERSNPEVEAGSGDGKSTRLKETYATEGEGKKAADLLNLVYRERQREFVAEGKRWYDIVRQCEYAFTKSEETSTVLGTYNTMSNTVKNRLRQLYSLYNPIYSEEIKVAGVAVGGKLVQNPVWDRYTKD